MPMLCLQDPKEGMADPSAPLPVPQVLEGLPMRKLISLVCNPPGQQWICASLRLSVCFRFALGSLQAVLWGLVERTSGERWYRYFDILKCVFLHLLDVEGFMVNVCHNFSLPSIFFIMCHILFADINFSHFIFNKSLDYRGIPCQYTCTVQC